jgi:hypothetical protein
LQRKAALLQTRWYAVSLPKQRSINTPDTHSVKQQAAEAQQEAAATAAALQRHSKQQQGDKGSTPANPLLLCAARAAQAPR